MKDKLLTFIIFISVLFSFTGCGVFTKIFHKENKDNTEIVLGAEQNMYQTTYKYSVTQVDSMCVADYLPRNFDEWLKRSYTDYETNQTVARYLYIKELNNNNEMIYIITPKGEIYVVSKRKVVTE